ELLAKRIIGIAAAPLEVAALVGAVLRVARGRFGKGSAGIGRGELIAAGAELLAAEVPGHRLDDAGKAALAGGFRRGFTVAVRAAARGAHVRRLPRDVKADRRLALEGR